MLLTARAECFLVGHPDPLRESIRRLTAYAEAGADVLYAPGPRKRDDIAGDRRRGRAEARERARRLRISGSRSRISPALGVRRISVGSALSRAAWSGFIAGREADGRGGQLCGFDGSVAFAELNGFFREDLKERSR